MDGIKTIGIVGGVASGKSLVARLFAELGAGLLDADLAGHFVLTHDPEVKQLLVDRWGPRVLAADGSVNRAAVAACVFDSIAGAEAERHFLESQLHPRIRAKLEERANDFAVEETPAVVLDAPLLLEAGWGPSCDFIVMVDVPREIRLARAKDRGWSEDEFNRRELAQWPTDQKRQHADFVLTNTGSVDDLRPAVRHIWETRVVG
jgi:dephospho-CoA kinase